MNYRGREKGEREGILPIANSGVPLEKQSLGRDYFTSAKWHRNIIKNEIKWKLLLPLTAILVLFSILFEYLHLSYTLNSCRWNKWENWDKGATPRRIALIADPQIVDDNSYPGRLRILTKLSASVTDRYLKKNYRGILNTLDPDSIIFLGDLFDGGREWNNDGWFTEYDRFNKIFPKEPTRRYVQSLPGNHDIGFESISRDRYNRFSTFFGETNDFIEIGNHTIILLDTISLSSQDQWLKSKTARFLDQSNNILNARFPRILLTHVPLYRYNDKQSCGPNRESHKKFPVLKGKQYQTVIEYDISQHILTLLHPKMVFSGDDHDYCEVTHSYQFQNDNTLAKEITVKSSSMAGGIKYPAIQLLSLNNPYNPTSSDFASKETISTALCYLPSPYVRFIIYVILVIAISSCYVSYYFAPKYLAKYLSIFSSRFSSIEAESSIDFASHINLKHSRDNGAWRRSFFINILVLLTVSGILVLTLQI